MKATELRQGNLVYKTRPDGKEIIEVESIYKHFINGLGISAIEPIPLTEEWLIRFGFIRDEFNFYENESRLSIYPKGELFLGVWGATTIGVIESVNRLQNLNFALTGEELTLKNEGL